MKTSTKIGTFQPVEKRLFIGDVNGFIMEVEIQSLRKATDSKERLNGGARVSLLRRPNRNPSHSVCHFDSQNEAIYEIFHFLFTKLTPDLTIIELDHRAFSIDGALIFGVRDSFAHPVIPVSANRNLPDMVKVGYRDETKTRTWVKSS